MESLFSSFTVIFLRQKRQIFWFFLLILLYYIYLYSNISYLNFAYNHRFTTTNSKKFWICSRYYIFFKKLLLKLIRILPQLSSMRYLIRIVDVCPLFLRYEEGSGASIHRHCVCGSTPQRRKQGLILHTSESTIKALLRQLMGLPENTAA